MLCGGLHCTPPFLRHTAVLISGSQQRYLQSGLDACLQKRRQMSCSCGYRRLSSLRGPPIDVVVRSRYSLRMHCLAHFCPQVNIGRLLHGFLWVLQVFGPNLSHPCVVDNVTHHLELLFIFLPCQTIMRPTPDDAKDQQTALTNASRLGRVLQMSV